MQIFIKTLTGKTISVEADCIDTVQDLKQTIGGKEGIAAEHQRLVFAGKQLSDRHSLAFYNIERDVTLDLSLRLCGGGFQNVFMALGHKTRRLLRKCIMLVILATILLSLSSMFLIYPCENSLDSTAIPFFGHNQKILVTGGMGNIGMRLCMQLANDGYQVVSVDIDDRSHLFHVDNGMKFIQADITDELVLKGILKREHVFGIIHLAAVSRVQWCLNDPDYCVKVNTNATRVLVRLANEMPHVKWLIFASSREVYGGVKGYPVNEKTERKPLNLYGKTKHDSEVIIETIWQKPVIILRLSNVYGNPHDHEERLVPSLVRKAMFDQKITFGGGEQIMDFSHVDDVIFAFSLAVSKIQTFQPNKSLSSYNIVSGKVTRVKDLIDVVFEETGSCSPIIRLSQDARFPDHYEADPSWACSQLGFKARISDVREGIRLFIKDLRQYFIISAEVAITELCPNQDPRKSEWTFALPEIESCRAHLYGWIGGGRARAGKQYQRMVDIELNRKYMINFDGEVTEDDADSVKLSEMRIGYNFLDRSTYLVSEKDLSKLAIKADLYECRFVRNSTIPSDISPVQLYSPNEGQMDYIMLRNYFPSLDFSRPWHTRCSMIKLALRYQKQQLETPRRRNESANNIEYQQHSTKWIHEKSTSCMVDCATAQICLFDGKCRCINTDGVCSHDRRRLKIIDKRYDPQATISVFLEQGYRFWQAADEVLFARGDLDISVEPTIPSLLGAIDDPNRGHEDLRRFRLTWSLLDGFKLVHRLRTSQFTNQIMVLPMLHPWAQESWFTEVVSEFEKTHPHGSLENTAMIMAHDTGPCNMFTWTPSDLVDKPVLIPFSRGTHSISPMGDIYLRCFRAHDATVVPPVPHQRRELIEKFGNPSSIVAGYKRKYFLHFAASKLTIFRKRILGPDNDLLFTKVPKHRLLLGTHAPGGYMDSIAESTFCLHLRGTTGWATRLNDIIYGGCIPVIVVSDTIHPFENLLDWRRFSIRLSEDELWKVEDLLLSFSQEDIAMFQRNLLLVRDVFNYGPDGDIPSLNWNQGMNPLRLTVASLIKRSKTLYPVQR